MVWMPGQALGGGPQAVCHQGIGRPLRPMQTAADWARIESASSIADARSLGSQGQGQNWYRRSGFANPAIPGSYCDQMLDPGTTAGFLAAPGYRPRQMLISTTLRLPSVPAARGLAAGSLSVC